MTSSSLSRVLPCHRQITVSPPPPSPCRCMGNWAYNGTVTNFCPNLDNDPNGPWCLASEQGCVSNYEGNFTIETGRYMYCTVENYWWPPPPPPPTIVDVVVTSCNDTEHHDEIMSFVTCKRKLARTISMGLFSYNIYGE